LPAFMRAAGTVQIFSDTSISFQRAPSNLAGSGGR
jgi:hypothetical protein